MSLYGRPDLVEKLLQDMADCPPDDWRSRAPSPFVEQERRSLEETVFVDDGLGDEMEADLARGVGDDD